MAASTPMSAVPRPRISTTTQFLMTRAGYGFMLGATVALLEFAYYFPLVTMRTEIGLSSINSLLLVWGGEFVLLALAVGIAEHWVNPRELRMWQLALAVPVGAFASALIWHAFTQFVLRDQFGIRVFLDHLGQPIVWPMMLLYHSWLMLFFGGLAAAVLTSQRRRARMLAALRTAELGRATSQRRLAETGLASLRARVEPEFLLQSLARLEQSYETDPRVADRLLDELIAFLRGALADIRTSETAMSKPWTDDTRGRDSGLGM
jgi:hypothetical protein